MLHLDLKSRGAGLNTPNRFEPLYIDYSDENLEEYFDDSENTKRIKTQFFNDTTRTILAKNDSPDLGFTYSINPYRGCEHGCIYCYARPTHEYLGFSAGLDFETKIMVKRDAAKLLGEAFTKKSWEPQTIMFSGNTDCYQPVERKLNITRACLEVFLKFRNPVGVITKNALIQKDIDILKQLSELNLVSTVISVTTLKRELSRRLEPRTSVPKKRLETIYKLSSAGIPTGVNVAPIIPGLNDEEIPSILKAASDHGAKFAGRIILRLPYSVKDLFLDWLKRNYPEKASKIINRIHDVRKGQLNSAEWSKRFSCEGEYAEHIHKLFKISCEKYSLNKEKFKIRTDLFRRVKMQQEELFG
ncbi:MAG: PA0069 family radical SAM protein [Chlorobi bacterium]|nr:PA0069 family radical SAM protein [Chlorobiota bacterium]MCI0715306.1 PA0069 family radical SAM protein [Chlorobiota bacterium]